MSGSLYQELYNVLKNDALELLLEKSTLSSYDQQAIREIARLPHPSEATVEQIADICKKCLRSSLEGVAYRTSAARIAQVIEQSDLDRIPPMRDREPPYRRSELSQISETIQENNLLLRESLLNLNALNFSMQFLSNRFATPDIDMKGQCPHCGGALVEVLEASTHDPDLWDLRLRCLSPNTPACKDLDWLIQADIPTAKRP